MTTLEDIEDSELTWYWLSNRKKADKLSSLLQPQSSTALKKSREMRDWRGFRKNAEKECRQHVLISFFGIGWPCRAIKNTTAWVN